MRRIAWLPLALFSACADSPSNSPGNYRHYYTIDGLARETLVYVPQSASGSTAVPVVFMFHGTSGDGRKFYEISGWREKADAEGLIAVFPSALTHCLKEDDNHDGDFDDAGELEVTTKWAAGKLGDPARMPLCTAEELAGLTPERRALADHPLADDVAFVRAMLDDLASQYAIDTRRIYATGFSNGGSFTSRLAVEMADRFAAVAAASGGLDVDPVPGARPIPFVFSGGNLDDGVTEALGVTSLPLDESLLGFAPIEELVGGYLAAFGLDAEHSFTLRNLSGRSVAQLDYTTSVAGSGAGNFFSFMIIDGLGHQYPNGKNHPVVMADELWEVFRAESLPE